MNRLDVMIKIGRFAFYMTMSFAAIALTVSIVQTNYQVGLLLHRANTASEQLFECRGNAACLQSQILATVGSTKATMGAIAKAMPEITTSIKALSANSVEASKETSKTARTATALLEATNALVLEAHHDINQLTASADSMLKSTDKTVQQAGNALVELAKLEAQLNKQIEAGAPEAQQTLASMNKILADPSLINTLHSIDTGAAHMSEVATTVDIATRGLRQKAGRVKWVIERLTNMLKFTVPLF